jgi:hypothetical protein
MRHMVANATTEYDPGTLKSPFTLKQLIDWLTHIDLVASPALRPEQRRKLKDIVSDFNRDTACFRMTPGRMAALIGLCNTKKRSKDKDAMTRVLWLVLQTPRTNWARLLINFEEETFLMMPRKGK